MGHCYHHSMDEIKSFVSDKQFRGSTSFMIVLESLSLMIQSEIIRKHNVYRLSLVFEFHSIEVLKRHFGR